MDYKIKVEMSDLDQQMRDKKAKLSNIDPAFKALSESDKLMIYFDELSDSLLGSEEDIDKLRSEINNKINVVIPNNEIDVLKRTRYNIKSKMIRTLSSDNKIIQFDNIEQQNAYIRSNIIQNKKVQIEEPKKDSNEIETEEDTKEFCSSTRKFK